ncbi:MAG: hypothetical protein AB7F65_02440 [Dehalococcoidia bacterium]
MTRGPGDTHATPDLAAFDELPLETVEEAAGELIRRITVAMRDIGESRADDATGRDPSPRRRVAALAVLTELACSTFAAAAAGVVPLGGRVDRHPAAIAAVMYAAPTVPALLQRIEQDRRMLASHARGLAHRLDEVAGGAWPKATLRSLLSEVALAAPAECAQELDALLRRWDEAERAALERAIARDQGAADL